MVPRVLPQQVRASVGWIWEFFYPAGLERLHNVAIIYFLMPWIGVIRPRTRTNRKRVRHGFVFCYFRVALPGVAGDLRIIEV